MSKPIRVMGLTVNWQMGLGVVLILAGAILALALPNLKYLWFEGRAFGAFLVVVGVLELGSGVRRARGRVPKGILQELREDLGVGPTAQTPPTDPAPGSPEAPPRTSEQGGTRTNPATPPAPDTRSDTGQPPEAPSPR